MKARPKDSSDDKFRSVESCFGGLGDRRAMLRVLFLGVLVVGATTSEVIAEVGHDHHHDHGHGDGSAKSGDDNDSHAKLEKMSLQEVFAVLESAVDSASKAAVAGELAKLHGLSDDISHLATHLGEKAPESSKARISGATNNIIKLTESLHKQGDKGERDKAQQTADKLKGMMTVLKAQIADR